jgi:hypothetical protein
MALHTDIPTRPQIQQLLTEQGRWCVSIYLPTHRLSQHTDRDRLELRRLTRTAVEQLDAAGADPDEMSAVPEGLEAIAEDDDFWTRQADSLALFARGGRTRSFRLPNRLVSTVEVADRFHVKPLLRAITFPHEAFVLALAKRSVRLLEIGPDSPPQEVSVPDLPTDAWEPYTSKVFRARELNYVRRIDDALRGVFAGSEIPLILAATETIAALYRRVNTYPALVEGRVAGNPERTSDGDLAAAARLILDELYAAELADIERLLDERASHGRVAFDISDVARAATLGAVDTVLVDMDASLPGVIDDAGVVTFGRESEATTYGLLDEIARRVYLAGGRVLAVRSTDIPADGVVAALLRYSP